MLDCRSPPPRYHVYRNPPCLCVSVCANPAFAEITGMEPAARGFHGPPATLNQENAACEQPSIALFRRAAEPNTSPKSAATPAWHRSAGEVSLATRPKS